MRAVMAGSPEYSTLTFPQKQLPVGMMDVLEWGEKEDQTEAEMTVGEF